MVGAIIAPVLLAVLFYFADTRTGFGKISVRLRQIIIGITFGALACLATQFGVPFDGYVMNVRSAAPLTAGLVFGGPAGVLAGLIGGVYRWFSVYWGIPSYTRVACTIATILAGVISTLCNRFMFNGKKASWFYGVFIAIATEVFHMLLVFLTHMDDIYTAFEVVKNTAVTMIAANAVSLWAALVFVEAVYRRKHGRKKLSKPITQTFSVHLFVCIFVAFLATSIFTSFLQNNVSNVEVDNLLSMNVNDVLEDIRFATDRDLLSRTKNIARMFENDESLSDSDRETIRQCFFDACDTYNVSEINLVGTNGVISVSTNPDFDGFQMKSGGQAEEFLCLLNGEKTYVQSYQPVDFNSAISRKYAGVALSDGGFLQVGYDFKHYYDSVKDNLSDITLNRHIGQTGFLFILSGSDYSLVSAPQNTVTEENISLFVQNLDEIEDNVVLAYQSTEGENYYYMKSVGEGYTVVGCIPESEANFSRNISVYIGAFMQLVVFFVLFIMVFFLIKNIIVDNIHRINHSLARITGGDLSTRVDIRENEEFATLSDDINATVARLKEYISDAEKRIDMELSFAKSIQHSVLPSTFPAFPDRDEFDLYASMFTAKEVGGDFYDFYLLDDSHLAFLIADVSGKGIPAAMFMMNAKSVIKNLAETGLPAAEIFTQANEKLCAANEAEMFVTAWLGVLDLNTGKVKFVNAGHNPPLVKHADDGYEYLRSRPGFVLAGMEGVRYREGEFDLDPGDEIFLYTDGVTEASNPDNELFGEERLAKVLNNGKFVNARATCNVVGAAVDVFAGKAPQFDDITMLSLKFIKRAETKEE